MRLPRLRTALGQPGWSIRSSDVRAHLTRLGGQLGPVAFRLGTRTVAPLSVAPWAEEKLPPGTRPLLRALRGDFFCAPFGDNTRSWRGEKHPPHGEPANAAWSLEACGRQGPRTILHARLATKIRPGRIDKFVSLVQGQAALYQRHEVRGRGPMNLGHHAMVRFPDRPGSGIVSTSRFLRGQVFPGKFGNPEKGSYQSLRPGAIFRSLSRVPLAMGGTTDLSRFPARPGYDDAVMLTSDPDLSLAWTAVAFPAERYAWFTLRSPRILRHTLLWISHGGRHYPPWNGRHTGVMGLEDVMSYFQYGLAESVGPNPLSRRGIPTALTLDPREPVVILTVMAVAPLPRGFGGVADIRPAADGVELEGSSGRRVRCALDWQFLRTR